jgi:hypothetical protein
VELGDNTRYAVEGIGSIQFQLDSGSLMEVKEVMYVPGLEKIERTTSESPRT